LRAAAVMPASPPRCSRLVAPAVEWCVMPRFDELLVDVVRKPGMYIGGPSLRALSLFLSGYALALTDAGQPDPLYGWLIWVYHRFQIWHPAWSWTRVLIHVYGTDAAALSALVPLYTEF